MAEQKTYNFIKGLFVEKKTFNNGGEIFNIALTDEAIEAIKKLSKDQKGYRKLTMSEQKTKPGKYSVYENTFKPQKTNGPSTNSGTDAGDDLPF